MALVSPFKAVRPQKKVASQVASYPYDVISSEEARLIGESNPLSFLHISKSEIDFPAGIDRYSDDVYDKAKLNFSEFLNKRTLLQDRDPFFYIYSQKMGDHEQFGIVAVVHVSDFESGNVKRHELTLPAKQEDRTRHIERLNAQTGPIFLTYPSRRSIDGIVDKVVRGDTEYDFVADDGIRHRIWVIRDGTDALAIRDEFSRVESLYIADGHHRAASAVEVARRRRKENPRHTGAEQYNLIMSVLFPHDQLTIMDYNRAVKDLKGMGTGEFFDRVCSHFELTAGFASKRPQGAREFGMYLGGIWYKLKARKRYGECDATGVQGVSILQQELLGPVLGITDPRTDPRIKFIGGVRGMAELERLVDSGEYIVVFSICPPTVEQIMKVADEGKIMPPKSTWFEPKLRSGLFVHMLD
jgi:uncharacterized protein (DUF1015 family)